MQEENVRAKLLEDIFGQSDEDMDLEAIHFDSDEEKPKEYEERSLPSFKKDAKKKTPRQKKEPKPKEPEPQKSEVEVDLEAALDKVRQKKKKRDLQEEAEIDEVAADILQKMKSSALDDLALNNEQKPATEKLKVFPIVMDCLGRNHWHVILLENSILEGVKLWLEPLDDGSLPPLDIQMAMMSTLEQMPIETHHLHSSYIGRIVMFYTKCARVVPQIKKIAQGLLRKWMRPILKKSANYRDRQLKSVVVKKSIRKVDMTAHDETRIPKPLALAFTVAPASSVSAPVDKKPDQFRKLKSTLGKIKMKKH